MIKITKDRQFLIAEHEKGRRGSMAGIDAKLAKTKKRKKSKKSGRDETRKEPSWFDRDFFADSSASCSSEEMDIDQPLPEVADPSMERKRKRSINSTLTSAVLSTLDRAKRNDRCSVYNLSAVLHASDELYSHFNINCSRALF